MSSVLSWVLACCMVTVQGLSYDPAVGVGSRFELPDYSLTDAWLNELVNKIDSDFDDGGSDDYLNLPTKEQSKHPIERHPQLLGQDLFRGRVTKDEQPEDGFSFNRGSTHAKEPTIRDHEYLQHSTLWGNKYVAGGAGEGSQHLKPDGSMKNPHEIKTDPVLPAYCNPPNPCPVGYTEADGCITEFSNTASFSRTFQASQECMCDSEHMFDCPPSSSGNGRGSQNDGSKHQSTAEEVSNRNDEDEKHIDALAQSITNQGLNANNIDQLIKQVENREINIVSKKHFMKAPKENANPYLSGEKLPVQAKKSPGIYW